MIAAALTASALAACSDGSGTTTDGSGSASSRAAVSTSVATGPMSTVRDRAVLLPKSSKYDVSSLNFTVLADPVRLVLPGGEVRVVSKAEPAMIPAWFEQVAAQEGTGDGPALRPAPGQRLRAYEVLLGAGQPYPDDSYANGGPEARDASATVSVTSGQQSLVITQPDASAATDGLRLGCAQLPCGSADRRERSAILWVVSDSSAAAHLSALVNGSTVSVPLAGGKTAGVVSDVWSRKNTSQQIDASWPGEKVTIQVQDSYSRDATFGGTVDQVFLTAFQREQGWARPGRAWLVVPMSSLSTAGWKVDPKSYWMEVAGKRLDPVNAAEPELVTASGDASIVFDVPTNFTTGTYFYKPQGTVTFEWATDTSPRPFAVGKAQPVPISIPAG